MAIKGGSPCGAPGVAVDERSGAPAAIVLSKAAAARRGEETAAAAGVLRASRDRSIGRPAGRNYRGRHGFERAAGADLKRHHEQDIDTVEFEDHTTVLE